MFLCDFMRVTSRDIEDQTRLLCTGLSLLAVLRGGNGVFVS